MGERQTDSVTVGCINFYTGGDNKKITAFAGLLPRHTQPQRRVKTGGSMQRFILTK